jgi:hypothetical protein
LDFDHIHGKGANVACLIANGATIRRLQQEIDRCQVLCSNCIEGKLPGKKAGSKTTYRKMCYCHFHGRIAVRLHVPRWLANCCGSGYTSRNLPQSLKQDCQIGDVLIPQMARAECTAGVDFRAWPPLI